MRFSYGPIENVPSGTEWNPEYVDAWADEGEADEWNPKSMLAEFKLFIKSQGLLKKHIPMLGRVYKHDTLPPHPNFGTRLAKVNYEDINPDSELLHKYPLWKPLQGETLEYAAIHGNKEHPITTVNRKMKTTRQVMDNGHWWYDIRTPEQWIFAGKKANYFKSPTHYPSARMAAINWILDFIEPVHTQTLERYNGRVKG